MGDLFAEAIEQRLQAIEREGYGGEGFGNPREDFVALRGGEAGVNAAGAAPCWMDALTAQQFNNALAELAQANTAAQGIRIAVRAGRRCCA